MTRALPPLTPRSQPLRVLVVAPDPRLARRLAAWVRRDGHVPTVIPDFVMARRELGERYDLLLSQLKLGAYNGLHLALRARAWRMPAIVLGHPDQTLAREASRLQARYLTLPLHRGRLLREVRRAWANRRFHRLPDLYALPVADHLGPLDLAAHPIDRLDAFVPVRGSLN